MQKFHLEDRDVKINDKTISIRIICEYEYESEEPIVEFESEAELKEYLNKFVTGEYSNLLIKVTVSFFDLKSFDYLSQVHVISTKANEQLIETVKDHLMIETAINDLMDKLKRTYSALKELFE
jgi:predicted transcriptional regulator